ncbi:uncharacterized protein KD926_004663 [Aspergillus affinis]|uniref:uncharacterized protein n=1 Tax=Aspergillus affinis TaxID=1070780 RepID=UPI0022FE2727|nr:uncharacterized protein KD926_004663 [Aspergillus affinis]KAI9035062.1 hypothetical protein KD926_004663 [Aspergillus affinis]
MTYSLQKSANSILEETGEIREGIRLLTEDAVLKEVPKVDYVAFNTDNMKRNPPSYCHGDTRKEILSTIRQWGEGGDDKCIFWLRGMAGTGKSTIARTVARMFDHERRLGASFFFVRGYAGRAEPSKLFPTIAYQLVRALPGFR